MDAGAVKLVLQYMIGAFQLVDLCRERSAFLLVPTSWPGLYSNLALRLTRQTTSGIVWLTSSRGRWSRSNWASCSVCGVTASSDRPNSSQMDLYRPTLPRPKFDCNRLFLDSVTDQAYLSPTDGCRRTSLGATTRPSRSSDAGYSCSKGEEKTITYIYGLPMPRGTVV